MGIGLKIKELSEQKKVDAVWIAKRLGKTKQAVYDIFSKDDVNTSILRVLADVFDVPVSYFFDDQTKTVTQKGASNVIVGRDNNGTIGDLRDCEKELEHTKALLAEKELMLAEKERLITVLMDKK